MKNAIFKKKVFLNVIILSIIFSFISCKDKNNYKVNLKEVSTPNLNYHNYFKDLMNINLDNFESEIVDLSDEYNVFLGDLRKDTTGICQIKNFLTDTSIQRIFEESEEILKQNYNKLNKEFTNSFKHILYYYPDFQVPDFYSYISGYDFEFPVIYNNNEAFMIIASDMFLGSNHSDYFKMGFPMYLIRKFDVNYLVSDCVNEIAKYYNKSSNEYINLLSVMIYYGKNMEFVKSMMPNIHDTILTGFTLEQMEWCYENEKEMWEYLVNENLLFSNNLRLINKMIEPAPFTSYFSNSSPGCVARWIGWRIVSSYRTKNNMSLTELMEFTDPTVILQHSNYRPKR